MLHKIQDSFLPLTLLVDKTVVGPVNRHPVNANTRSVTQELLIRDQCEARLETVLPFTDCSVEEFPCMKSLGLNPYASSWLMTVLISPVASRFVMLEFEPLPDGTKPWAASLLTTRSMSGKARFSRAADSRSGTARLEVVVPSVPLAGTKPCWPSKAMTRGTLGMDRFSISGSRLKVSRFEVVVAFALGT